MTPAPLNEARPVFAMLGPGDPAPRFVQRSTVNEQYSFDTVAGRYVVLCFFGAAGHPGAQRALGLIAQHRALFDDVRFSFFGVSLDPADEACLRAAASLPGLRHFFDFDGAVSRLYGALARDARLDSRTVTVQQRWVVLDPTLRVIAVVPFAPDGSDGQELIRLLEGLPPTDRFAGVELQPPILFLPNVFEADLCARLIALFEADGGSDSGFMQEVSGRTVGTYDYGRKRRRDWIIEDEGLRAQIRTRIERRINPEIRKAYQFNATRIERFIVGCYTAEDGGHFLAHRDNTTRGTAHRRFAISINLNGDYEGGELRFPEYGHRGYKPPPGGAVVFSCSLLHAASRVTAGRRYVFLPFLYDDEAARLREANNRYLGEGVECYGPENGG